MTTEIMLADLSSSQFADLVDKHTTFCDGTAPAESCHRLPLSELANDDVTVWQVVLEDQIIGMGALKALSDKQGEVKSMHVFSNKRGLGVGALVLNKIIETARTRNYESLWLETGVHPDFAPARKLYKKHGFVETGPFGDYTEDPHSLFMTLPLTIEEGQL